MHSRWSALHVLQPAALGLLVLCGPTLDAQARGQFLGPGRIHRPFFRHCVRADAQALDLDLLPKPAMRPLGLNIDFACPTLRESEFDEIENMLVHGPPVHCTMERHDGLFIRVCTRGQNESSSW